MSDNPHREPVTADAASALPNWLRPLAAVRGPRALLVAGSCVFALSLIYLVDVSTPPGTSLGAAAIIPVVAATWVLSGRVTVLVTLLALFFRLAAALGGAVPTVEAVTDCLTIVLVASLGRVAATYVTRTQAAAARAGLMARVARIATSAESLKEILDRILREMAGEGLRGGMVALINERNEIYPAAAEGDIDEAVWSSRLPVGSGIMGTVADTGRSILIQDIDAPDVAVPPANRSLGSNARIKSLIAVPLLAAGKVIGVLELDSAQVGRFDERDVSLLEQIALAVSDAVQREGALQLADEKVQRRVEELSLLLEAARSLAASLEPEVVLGTVVRMVARAVRAEGGHAALIRIENDRLTAISDDDGETVRTRAIDFPLAFAPAEMLRAIESGQAVGCDRGRLEPELADVFGDTARSFAWAPVRIGGQLYGVVTATSDRQLFEWPALRLLEGVADLAGLAIGNAERLRMELSRTTELQAHADRMAELEKVKSDFLKVASHELRGPLAILKGYVSMLSDGSLALDSPATAKVFTVVTGKLQEVSELVEQMLETARLEDSRLQLHLERQELTGVLAEAAERVRPLAPANHRVELRLDIESGPVLADRDRLLTIITNLMDNAVKYSPEGGAVEVRLTAVEGRALIAVQDHGLGIAAADQPRLFTRFGRIVTPGNSHIPGTGLGLYFARELARMHGGDITVVSEEGVGSTFTVSLPMVAERQVGPVRSVAE
ncbi:MAG: GAF domain-containing protein [Candidatus Dormibacteraeota bacterium]|nr:GAF domain-containing protein [Candidatus Dormibacteraeota bacterium]